MSDDRPPINVVVWNEEHFRSVDNDIHELKKALNTLIDRIRRNQLFHGHYNDLYYEIEQVALYLTFVRDRVPGGGYVSSYPSAESSLGLLRADTVRLCTVLADFTMNIAREYLRNRGSCETVAEKFGEEYGKYESRVEALERSNLNEMVRETLERDEDDDEVLDLLERYLELHELLMEYFDVFSLLPGKYAQEESAQTDDN